MVGLSVDGRTSGRVPARLEGVRASAVLLAAAVGVAYYLGAQLGLTMSLVERNVTPLWPPTGIAVAGFVLLGRSTWPGVLLAALAVNLPINESAAAAAVTAVGNTTAPLLAAYLLERVGFRRQLDRRQDAVALVFLAALASMLLSATVGAGALVVSGEVAPEQLSAAWLVWWTGDAMGVLAVAPFLLSLPLVAERPSWPLSRWLEAVALLLVVGAVTLWAATTDQHLIFLTLAVLGWAAWRLQLRGAAPAALLASLTMTWAAAHRMGPFRVGSLFEQMLVLQAFNACVALTSFFLAALVSERLRDARRLQSAAADLERRVARRTAELSAANQRLVQEIRERFEAEEQLGLEEARARREHQIAESLQRSLLPDRLPAIPGVELAARYVPATADVQVGGDWYDVVPLPGGLIGVAIGDVAGHGLAAAATMGQLRMALRAYALEQTSPLAVVAAVHRLACQLPVPEIATLLYLVLDPSTRRLSHVNAGHLPLLVVDGSSYSFLEDGLAPPVGAAPETTFVECQHTLPPGATLVLCTDGLVERRRVSIQEGLDRLGELAVRHRDAATGDLCDLLLESLLPDGGAVDDVAVVALRADTPGDGPFRLVVDALPQHLVQVRGALRGWLVRHGIADGDLQDLLVACGEACANAVQHAYLGTPGTMEVDAHLSDGTVVLSVRDHGTWRTPGDRGGGGWGLALVRGLMDDVEVEHGDGGTVVRVRNAVRPGRPG